MEIQNRPALQTTDEEPNEVRVTVADQFQAARFFNSDVCGWKLTNKVTATLTVADPPCGLNMGEWDKNVGFHAAFSSLLTVFKPATEEDFAKMVISALQNTLSGQHTIITYCSYQYAPSSFFYCSDLSRQLSTFLKTAENLELPEGIRLQYAGHDCVVWVKGQNTVQQGARLGSTFEMILFT